jgi:hypothetical protein
VLSRSIENNEFEKLHGAHPRAEQRSECNARSGFTQAQLDEAERKVRVAVDRSRRSSR